MLNQSVGELNHNNMDFFQFPLKFFALKPVHSAAINLLEESVEEKVSVEVLGSEIA